MTWPIRKPRRKRICPTYKVICGTPTPLRYVEKTIQRRRLSRVLGLMERERAATLFTSLCAGSNVRSCVCCQIDFTFFSHSSFFFALVVVVEFQTSFVAALSATAISLAVLIFGTDTSVAPQAPPMMPPPMMPPPMTMPYQPATPYYPYYQQQVPALPMQPTLPGQRQQAPPITEPEVRALFQKWNSALKTRK